MNKLKIFDSSYFNSKSYFEEDCRPNYLMFQPLNKYFKVGGSNSVLSWTRKGLSHEIIKPPAAPDLTPQLYYLGSKTIVSFPGVCLKQDKVTFNHGKIVNIYIVYRLIKLSNPYKNNNLTVQNALFGAVTLTKNADIDKYKYSGYGIAFDKKSFGENGQNVIILGVDMNSSVHIDNKGKDILILGKSPTQGLGEHSLTAEKMYSINFTKNNTKFCLSLHYNGANSYLFVNGTEIIKFKAKDDKIMASQLCLENISKDWSTDNMRKTNLIGYDFSVSYDAIDVDDIKDIHKYLMKKHDIT